MKIEDNGGGNFEPIPTGPQGAVFSRIIDIGLQPGYQGGAPAHKMVVIWELAARRSDGRRHEVSKTYTVSMHEKSSFRKDVQAFVGKKIDLAGGAFDTDRLLGLPCTLNLIEVQKSDGKIFAEIKGIMPAMPGAEAFKPENFDTPKWVERVLGDRLDKEPGDSIPF